MISQHLVVTAAIGLVIVITLIIVVTTLLLLRIVVSVSNEVVHLVVGGGRLHLQLLVDSVFFVLHSRRIVAVNAMSP